MRYLAALWLLSTISLPVFAQESESTTPPVIPMTEEKSEPVAESKACGVEQGCGMLGIPLRIGPSVSVGIPFLLNLSLDAIWAKTWGASLAFGSFSMDVGDVKAKMQNFDVRGRWFPWQGSFFLGAAFGQQTIGASLSDALKNNIVGVEVTIPTTISLEVKTMYLTPHLGWFATWDVGFSLGFEIGYQIALSASADFDATFGSSTTASGGTTTVNADDIKTTNEYKSLQQDAEESAKNLGMVSVPYLNLLRLGWLF